MSAGTLVQDALVQALTGIAEIAGVYGGPPPRAAFPYAVVDAGTEFDWSHKNAEGREIAIALTLWDDVPARLETITKPVTDAVDTLVIAEPWQLVSLRLQRKRVLWATEGPWAVALDFRARLLKPNEENN